MNLKVISTDTYREFLLINLFVINLLISTISNYKPYTFYLKLFSTLTLFFLIIIDMKKRGISFTSLSEQAGFKKSLLLKLILLSLCGISLSYSLNLSYGIQKFFHLIVSTIPAIVMFYYLVSTITEKRLQVFISSTLATVVVITFIVIVAVPFDFKQLGIIDINKWSHVIFGRYVLLALVVTLYLFFNSESKKGVIGLSIVLQMNLLGIYFSGFRAGLLGSIIITTLFVIHFIIKKRYDYRKISIIAFAFLLTFTLPSIIKPEQTQVHQRYLNLLSDDLSKDGPINSRFISYDASFKKIKDRPILGEGFGGFANNNYGDVPVKIKYPHNMILEFWVELGIPGLVLIIFLTYSIFRSSIKISAPVTIYLIGAFWLAMFSKDIPSQTMFLLGIALIWYEPNKFLKNSTNRTTK